MPNLQKRTRSTRRGISRKRSRVTKRSSAQDNGAQTCFTILATLTFERATLDTRSSITSALEMQQSAPERYLRFASVNQYSIAAAVAFWLGVFCIVRLLFARRRSTARIILSVFLLFFFAIGTLAIYELDHGSKGRDLAIVTDKEVQARLATADTANSVLALPPGSEIKILSTRGDWMYAALPNSFRGWIPAKSAEQVRL